MNRKEAAELSPFIKAFGEGKIIESSSITDVSKAWREVTDFPIGMIKNFKFRIKPEQKYRPFANVEECWQELLKHKPFGWVKDTEANEYLNVYCISNSASSIDLFGRMFKRCICIDGSPYGIKVEE